MLYSSTSFGKDDQFHVHALVIFTANHGADYFIVARLIRGSQKELLRAWLEQQAPSLYFRPVLGSQQGEAMYRSIAIPRFSSARGYAQKYLFSSGQCDLWTPRAAYLIPAVLVRQQFNDADLGVKRQRGKDHGSRGDSQEPTKNQFPHVPTRQNQRKGYCVM
jgi:hypothetical protein